MNLSAPLTRTTRPARRRARNVILTAPLTKAHATGVTVAYPLPVISAAKATELQGLLADAKAKANASDTAGAIAALQQFKTAAGSKAPLSTPATR